MDKYLFYRMIETRMYPSPETLPGSRAGRERSKQKET